MTNETVFEVYNPVCPLEKLGAKCGILLQTRYEADFFRQLQPATVLQPIH
jgi:hypothetical protein